MMHADLAGISPFPKGHMLRWQAVDTITLQRSLVGVKILRAGSTAQPIGNTGGTLSAQNRPSLDQQPNDLDDLRMGQCLLRRG